jgi:hypothetical protein
VRKRSEARMKREADTGKRVFSIGMKKVLQDTCLVQPAKTANRKRILSSADKLRLMSEGRPRTKHEIKSRFAVDLGHVADGTVFAE